MTKKYDKLKSEAEFQNKRSRGELDKHVKRRNKFYYLIQNALDLYNQSINSNILGKRVIVAGCAEGQVTPLAKQGVELVIGIDISDEAIKNLDKAINESHLEKNAKAVVGNAEDLQITDKSYDLICCSGVLHHLDIELAMNSWTKALKDNGKVIMMEPMAMNPIVYLYRILTPSMRTKDEHPLLPKDFKILKKYFKHVDVHGFVFTSILSLIFAYLPNIFSLKEKSYQLLESLDRKLIKLFPFLSYFCWTSIIILKNPIHDQ